MRGMWSAAMAGALAAGALTACVSPSEHLPGPGAKAPQSAPRPGQPEPDRPEPDRSAWPLGPLAALEAVEAEPAPDAPDAIVVRALGQLPTPCHELVVNRLDAGAGRVTIELASRADPERICIQVLSPFSWSQRVAPLNPRDYVVSVNGVERSVTLG
ncbi:MAG: hypothetical protein ACKVWR_16625 [Acidimicrobiales bacterium]